MTLASLEKYIYSGEPVPIAWVVKNSDTFQKSWNKSVYADRMITIAAHVADPKDLVRTVAAVARTALRRVKKYYGEYDRIKVAERAIEISERWAAGKAASTELIEAAKSVDKGWDLFGGDGRRAGQSVELALKTAVAADAGKYSAIAEHAGGSVSFAGYAGVSLDFNDRGDYNRRPAAEKRAIKSANAESANIIRRHIHITVSDIVRAGKNGWQP